MTPTPYSIGQLGAPIAAALRGSPKRPKRRTISPSVEGSSNTAPVNSARPKHLGVQFQEAGLHDKITVHEVLTLFASFYDTPARRRRTSHRARPEGQA